MDCSDRRLTLHPRVGGHKWANLQCVHAHACVCVNRHGVNDSAQIRDHPLAPPPEIL